jgi:hypothetical protein
MRDMYYCPGKVALFPISDGILLISVELQEDLNIYLVSEYYLHTLKVKPQYHEFRWCNVIHNAWIRGGVVAVCPTSR